MKKYAWRLRMLSRFLGGGMLVLFALSSCRSQAVTACVDSTDSVRQTMTQVRVDSVYVRDSIHIRERGDTVFVDRWHVRWKERAAMKADTVYIDRHQSEIKIAPPERYVPKFYKWCAGILCGVLAAGTGYLLRRWLSQR